MASKIRVHELAKELGVTSKELREELTAQGEFVKSASSTIEAPVARRLRETYAQRAASAVPEQSATDETGSSKQSTASKRSSTKITGSKNTQNKATGAMTASRKTTQTSQATSEVKSTAKSKNARATDVKEPAEVTQAAPAPHASSATDTPTGTSSLRQHVPSPASLAKGRKKTEAQSNVVETPPAPSKTVVSKTTISKEQAPSSATEVAQSASTKSGVSTAASTQSSASGAAVTPAPSRPKPSGIPRPAPRAARIGNNPYQETTSTPRPGPRPGSTTGRGSGPRPQSGSRPASGRPDRSHSHGQGQPRPGGGQSHGPGRTHGASRPGSAPRPQGGSRPARTAGPRSGPGSTSPRPHPGAMPTRSSRPSNGRPGRSSVPAGRGGDSSNYRGGGTENLAASPTGYRGRGGGRPGQRGGTAGAFGRPGGAPKRGRKSKRQKKQEFDAMQVPAVGGIRLPRGNGDIIRLAHGASLSDFAEKIEANPASLVQALFNLGEMVTATQSVSDDTLELLGGEMNYVVKMVSPEDEDRELLNSFDLTYGEDDGSEEDLVQRPPVVTVMGHVDHGKTRLLDTIRKANVRGSEYGGITQHIGAYQIQTNLDGRDRLITFIDTPGHEAFTAMRARGAQATDIAVVVVAADDGVMPQTVEAINHAQAAGVPIVVAVNKIDKEGADPQKIRGQLMEYGLVDEQLGGDTMFIDISAKQGIHIDRLLEAILLTADAALDLRANPNMPAQGVAVEAHLDRGRGPVATVLVERGTLQVGDSVVAGDAYGRVRRMVDEYGKDVPKALPSRPVQVIGFTSVPGAGDSLLVVEEDRVARQIADRRNARKRNAMAARTRKISLEDLDTALKETPQLNLILKGDNAGTVEALESALLNIALDDEVQLQVIDRGVGGVTETNVDLAAASNAIIIGFNVRAEGKATERANREGVEIRYYTVIYQAIEEVEKALKGMLKPIYEEVDLGAAQVRAIFRSSKVGVIAGCLVTSGVIQRNTKARLVRDGVVIADSTTIVSLRREKDDVTEVREGFECGVTLGYSEIKEGDEIQVFELREKPRD